MELQVAGDQEKIREVMKVTITMQHVRTIPDGKNVGYCAPGVKRFFKKYGLDLRKFCREGLPEEDFLATGDQKGIKLVEWAYEQEQ